VAVEGKRVVIVGTAHVSPRSIREVEETIEKEMPQAVAVELCYKRYLTLVEGEQQEVPLTDVIKRGETHLLLFQLLLAYFQKRIGEGYGVKPGEEMLAAIKKAKELNADVVLIDRDIAVTLRRFWNSLSLFEKLRLIYHLIKGLLSKEEVRIDEVLEEDVLELLVKEFKEIAPSAADVLIDERDAYMAANLIRALHKYDRIVAVVGAGHKKGIEGYLLDPARIPDQKELERFKVSRINPFKVIAYSVFAAVILIFAVLLSTLNSELIIRAFLYWFFINGALAAIGAAMARAHILSILSAFLFAWLTSLNPTIAAGWVSGIVETWVRKPTASDLQGISKAKSLRELMHNKFFKVLLVVALTNIGSMIGTFLGLYFVVQITGIDIPSVLKGNFGGVFGRVFDYIGL
jgi:pheromone shutdown-related protein TraB